MTEKGAVSCEQTDGQQSGLTKILFLYLGAEPMYSVKKPLKHKLKCKIVITSPITHTKLKLRVAETLHRSHVLTYSAGLNAKYTLNKGLNRVICSLAYREFS